WWLSYSACQPFFLMFNVSPQSEGIEECLKTLEMDSSSFTSRIRGSLHDKNRLSSFFQIPALNGLKEAAQRNGDDCTVWPAVHVLNDQPSKSNSLRSPCRRDNSRVPPSSTSSLVWRLRCIN